MKKSFTRKFSLVLAGVMAFGSAAFAATAQAAPAEQASTGASYGLPEKIEDGAILHCWTWSFNTIKENLPQIAQAGFKAVQTSPVNKVREPKTKKDALKSSGNDSGNWWYQYQPTDYTIGNYMLGTEDEFKELCVEAHKLGIKVVADIVSNHCTSEYNQISSTIKSVAGNNTFHKVLQITDWSNREQVTQGHLTGLWDLNTQNEKVQQMIVDYTNRVLADGADGFRFDAAKHIELPDDPGFGGNFWPTVLDNDAEFQYGEILLGADRAADYAKLMKITAEGYGTNLRAALSKQKLTSATAKNYRLTGVEDSKLVTWVESHDTYCTDDVPANNQFSSWYTTTNDDIKRGWAVICAQGDTTPLFYARPQGSGARIEGGTTTQNFNQKWGDNTIGIAGDGNYYSDEVAAVNKFRNAMVGEGKNLVDVVRQKVTMIERGTKGAVLVSVSDSDNTINTATNLADGEYTDQVSGAAFTVADGKLSGTVKAGAVVVLYTPEEEPEDVLVGDLNKDGKVDVQDATILQRHLAEFKNDDGSAIIDMDDPKQVKIADYDGDGTVSVLDVTAMQRAIAEFGS
ncbi:MAG: alpha-amylase [Ruminococcus sp.]|nr:alpha-amylase [Ruminococcus sp.]